MTIVTTPSMQSEQPRSIARLFWLLLLIAVLAGGTALRFTGVNWDEGQHLHPDERFLTMVTSGISTRDAQNSYFDTSKSPLNPSNSGHGFYVYGTLPIFVVRYIGEALGMTGYDEITLVGRVVSAVVDVFTVLLVFVIALVLFRKHSLATIAAALSAFSVLQIQQAHFYTVDSFANFSLTLCLTFLAFIYRDMDRKTAAGDVRLWNGITLYVLFGISLAMAAASKISYAPAAILLPLTLFVVLTKYGKLRDRESLKQAAVALLVAGGVTLIGFRIMMPYAFTGPGFFNILPSEKWLASMREISAMSAGDVDFPPALQWARRPLTFSLHNMVIWGMGIAWGVTAWISFIWMGWRIFRERWYVPLPIWAWTLFNFVMQSVNFTRSMRYQLPIYPSLAIIGAWGLVELFRYARRLDRAWLRELTTALAVATTVAVVGYTAWYAVAFTGIYQRPVTRVEASKWIYENVPTSLAISIETDNGTARQAIVYSNAFNLSTSSPMRMAFTVEEKATPVSLRLPYMLDSANPDLEKTVEVKLCADAQCNQVLTSGALRTTFSDVNAGRGSTYMFPFICAPGLQEGATYYIKTSMVEDGSSVRLYGTPELNLIGQQGERVLRLSELTSTITQSAPFENTFKANYSGVLKEIKVGYGLDWLRSGQEKLLTVTLTDMISGEVVDRTRLTSAMLPVNDPRGQPASAVFSGDKRLQADTVYRLMITLHDSDSQVALYGSRQALETTWDDKLPVNLYGYSAFDYNIGQYRSEIELEMYWDDNLDKLARLKNGLDQADYYFISSSRVWGSVVQIPERYPLSIAFYRGLMGCPEDKDLFSCYADAKPGMFTSQFGFELERVFQSEPCLWDMCLNSQYAEEAFNVYDHPKVFIFKKTEAYSPENVATILDQVDLSGVIRPTPRQASDMGNTAKTLNFSESMWQNQTEGGTWSKLFDRADLINTQPLLATVWWYLMLTILGIAMLPALSILFGNMLDRGYAAGKLIGLMLLAWLSWLGGSLQIPVTRLQITGCFALIAGFNLVILLWRKKAILTWVKENKRFLLTLEAVSLVAFIVFLLVRLGNPDLWHLYKGGEKPMDFSYLNAIIKSTVYPPYDPWFAGGYINYYYYGFVIFGTLIKWLGVMPSIGYNLLLASVFSFASVLVFSLVYQLYTNHSTGQESKESLTKVAPIHFNPLLVATIAVFFVLIIGNFGTVRMIWQGFQRMVPEYHQDAGVLQQILWAGQGFAKSFVDPGFGYAPGEWYWNPSRAIPGDVITEFPAFTFLYGDPHAHLMALPITILAIYWAFSVVRRRWQETPVKRLLVELAALILAGAWIIGTLMPANTWDFYTYAALAACLIAYALLMYGPASLTPLRRAMLAAGSIILLIVLSKVLFLPFSQYYAQAYTKLKLWDGPKSPMTDFLVHWGFFLTVIISWLIWETRNWMETTRLSALKRYKNAMPWLGLALIAFVLVSLALVINGINIAFLVIFIGIWIALLLLRSNLSDAQRLVLFMSGTALALMLVVEIFVMVGDIGRMNTVFKLYLQAWVLLGISAAAAFGWLVNAAWTEWQPRMRTLWVSAMILLGAGVMLFPLLAGADKITDRIAADAPHTLDGMAYMPYATAYEGANIFRLDQDYNAIRWMQDNIVGSPVIVEANVPEYRWGNRYTIYTGLPGVVGWNWHQRQQRAVLPPTVVTDRVEQIGAFYMTTDPDQAVAFLRKYKVSYIIVGLLERALYPAESLAKFDAYNGIHWDAVYTQDQTIIYKVRE